MKPDDIQTGSRAEGASLGDRAAGHGVPRRRPIDRAALGRLAEKMLWMLLAITGAGAADWSDGDEAAFLFVALSVILFAWSSGLHPLPCRTRRDRPSDTAGWAGTPVMRLLRFGGAFAFAAALLLLVKTGEDAALATFQAVYLTAGSGVVLFATLLAGRIESILAARGHFRVVTVVLGAGANGKRFIDSLRARDRHDVVLLGVFDDRTSRVPEFVAGYPILGGMDDLFDFLRSQPVDQVVVALPWSAEARIVHFIERLRPMGVEVRLCPDLIGMRIPDRGVSSQGGVSLINVHSFERSPGTRLAKRALDILGAAGVLLFMAPVIALVMLVYIGLGIRPTILAQDCIGRHGRTIRLWSFGAPFARDEVDRSGGGPEPVDADVPSVTGRPAPTPRGSNELERAQARDAPAPARRARPARRPQRAITDFLARSGIAGLPRFVSVLKGDLSLVGVSLRRSEDAPRAALFAGPEPACGSCLRVKPGLTGPAQLMIAGHVPLSRAEQAARVMELDMTYAETWSLALDLAILWRSVAADWQPEPR